MTGARPPGRRAAQYLRMSTEHQRYSTENQAIAIRAYARRQGLEIVKTYLDEGVSGLTLRKRPGLQALLADAVGGDPGFEVILVYDVSRWGRFQNPDQSAHYEFLCVEAGVPVEYCDEAFENDGSLAATILKSVTRVMAAKFSRDLSVKVTAGKRLLARRGYWPNSAPGLGLRRQMVDENGAAGLVLERGQYKAIQSCHTTLVPGPADEVALVNRIYRLYVDTGLKRREIVRLLNAEGRLSDRGRPWTVKSLATVLSDPKYVGDMRYNRLSSTLDGKVLRRPKSEWKTVRNAWPGIVERKLFDAAQAAQRARQVRADDETILTLLRDLLVQHGTLTAALIDQADGLPHSNVVYRRFGGAMSLYARLGYEPPVLRQICDRLTDEQLLWRLARLFDRDGCLTVKAVNAEPNLPCYPTFVRRFGSGQAAFAFVGQAPMRSRTRATAIGQARSAAARAARPAWLDGPYPEP